MEIILLNMKEIIKKILLGKGYLEKRMLFDYSFPIDKGLASEHYTEFFDCVLLNKNNIPEIIFLVEEEINHDLNLSIDTNELKKIGAKKLIILDRNSFLEIDLNSSGFKRGKLNDVLK